MSNMPHFMDCGCRNALYTQQGASWESQNLLLSKFSKYRLETDVAAQIAIRRKDSGPSGAILADRGHVLRWESN